MGANTKIEWANHSWNGWIGCTKVSPACDNCYAEALNNRMKFVGYGGTDTDGLYSFRPAWGNGIDRKRTSAANWNQPPQWNQHAEIKFNAWNRQRSDFAEVFGVTEDLADAMLESKGFIKHRRPRVFCGSLCDVFDNAVPDEWRRDLFALIRATTNLDWLILTKRIGNANRMIARAVDALPRDSQCGTGQWNHHPIAQWPWPNVWIGATICNQEEADRDIPKLLKLPAAKRFLSIEPMLGPVDVREFLEFYVPKPPYEDKNSPFGLDWVICGGESGPHARPMHPAWVRMMRDQCAAAGVPFFFKQWGEWHPAPEIIDAGGSMFHQFSDGTWMQRVGKKAAGRLLDGWEWNEVPE